MYGRDYPMQLLRNWKGGARVGLFIAFFILAPALSQATVIYDASLGTTPSLQGWLLGALPLPPVQSVAGGVLSFASAAPGSAGYVKFPAVLLDADAGYRLAFELKVTSETPSPSADRAPFSLTAVSANTNQAIELGFKPGEIFSQDGVPNLFQRGEIASFNTMLDFVSYELLVHGAGYQLLGNGSSLLSGSLRDYGPFAGFPDPYETPNFLFFGDNTSSSGGSWELKTIELTGLPYTVSEPSSLSLVLLAGLVALLRRRS